jgi:hypothetical protein
VRRLAGHEEKEEQNTSQNGQEMMKMKTTAVVVDTLSLQLLPRGMVTAHPVLRLFTILNQVCVLAIVSITYHFTTNFMYICIKTSTTFEVQNLTLSTHL